MSDNHALQSFGVAVVTVVWTLTIYLVTYSYRNSLAAAQNAWALPVVSLVCTLFFLVVTSVLLYAIPYQDPNVPLVSPFSHRWFSIGWNSSLVFMGVRIDSPVAYGLIVNYQITRCILGSLLSNAFMPYVAALQSKLLAKEMKPSEMRTLLFSRACTDFYGFVSGLTDLILYVSQVDIFIVSGVITILTNWLVTSMLLKSSNKSDREEALNTLEERPHTKPFLFGGSFPTSPRLRL